MKLGLGGSLPEWMWTPTSSSQSPPNNKITPPLRPTSKWSPSSWVFLFHFLFMWFQPVFFFRVSCIILALVSLYFLTPFSFPFPFLFFFQ